MILKKILNRTNQLASEVAHFGRLGRVASQRSFLKRERRKLLLKMGEKTHVLLKAKKIEHSELKRLESQIEKLEQVLADKDFGGKDGVEFNSLSKPKKS